ncbi:MAG: ATP-binding protein [Lachnospiraceae bacterium]|nr:ATP-binding protein [Lachnospiraceae bacterium]
MTVSILLVIYLVETITYYMVYYLFYGKVLRRYHVPLIGMVAFIIFWLVYGCDNLSFARVVNHCMSVAVIYIVPKEKIGARITGTMILFFVVNCLAELLLALADGVLHFTKMTMNNDIKQLIVYTVQLFLFGIIVLLKKQLSAKSQNDIKSWFQRNVVNVVIFMAIAILFAIAGLKWVGKHVDNELLQGLTLAVCILANLGVSALGLFSVYVDRTNKKIKELYDNEKHIKDMQVRYYNTLLEREEDTRKYRHDMGNHLICLERLVEQKDLQAVEAYLYQMQQRMEEIQKRCYSTGNDILDILTNHYVNALGADVEVKVTGRIQTTMDQMQLCTIYANLLQNAVEELNRCQGPSLLEVTFTQGREYFQIVIKNTLSEVSKGLADNTFDTIKEDKRNHGLGLRNVRKTVEDEGGILEIEKNEEFFCAMVTLKVNK